MNDNLRELVFKAYTLCEKKTYGWIRNEEEFRQKFAEVIINECALVANEHNEGVEGVHLGVGRAIKNYFGVE